MLRYQELLGVAHMTGWWLPKNLQNMCSQLGKSYHKLGSTFLNNKLNNAKQTASEQQKKYNIEINNTNQGPLRKSGTSTSKPKNATSNPNSMCSNHQHANRTLKLKHQKPFSDKSWRLSITGTTWIFNQGTQSLGQCWDRGTQRGAFREICDIDPLRSADQVDILSIT